MAFPTIPTVAAGRIVSNPNTNPAGTHTFPNLNTLTAPAGTLIIALCIMYDGNSTNAEFSAWGGGFTEFVDQAGTATMGIGAAYKWSSGSEDGAFTVTSADASANDSVCILLAIPGAHASTPPEGGAIANGTSAAANIAALNPAGWDVADTLWIAVCGSGETGTGGAFQAPSAAPTDYGDLFVTAVTADAVGGVYGAVAFRQLAAASDDPGTFTVDTSNARNSALLIAVRPAPADVTGTAVGTFGFTGTAVGTIAPKSRQFDGSDDEITVDEGTLDAIPNGAWTVLCLFKATSIPDFICMMSLESSGPTQRLGAWVSNTPELLLAFGGTNYVFAGLGVSTDVWYLGAIKKAAGTATPRANIYSYTGAAWDGWVDSGTGAAGNIADAIVQVRFGDWPNNNPFPGLIAAAAVYSSALADATIEALVDALQDWDDQSPAALWAFNQATVADDVLDLTGNGANETAITGTVTSTDGPAGFDLSLGGSDDVEGTALGDFGFSGTVAGVRGVIGTAAGSFGFSGAAAGTRGVVGAAVGSFGFIGTAVGGRRMTGTALGDLGFSGTAAGVRGVAGTALGDLGFSGSAAGTAGVVGTAVGSLGFSGSAAGVRGVTGAAAGSFGFSGTAAGTRGVTGAAAGALGFGGTAAGTRGVVASAVGDFGFEGSATGTVEGAVLGSATGAFGFSGTAAGVVGVLGVASGAFTFSGTAVGRRTVFADAVGAFGFLGAATGRRGVRGVAAGGFGFAGTAAGTRGVIASALGAFGFLGEAVGGAGAAGFGTALGAFGFTGHARGRRIVTRPNTGTVVRPNTGIVVRPFTGVVMRP